MPARSSHTYIQHWHGSGRESPPLWILGQAISTRQETRGRERGREIVHPFRVSALYRDIRHARGRMTDGQARLPAADNQSTPSTRCWALHWCRPCRARLVIPGIEAAIAGGCFFSLGDARCWSNSATVYLSFSLWPMDTSPRFQYALALPSPQVYLLYINGTYL